MWQIGGYIVRSELGRGGMATVYLAEESLSRRLVALKVLHAELARSDEARRRFISEMQMLTTLEHPNLVRCYHCNDVNGQLIMALEYVKGRTLRALLDECNSLSVPVTCHIASGILAALNAAHTNAPPIIHRDLKPENVLLGDDGTVKVADFGIAKMLGTATTTTGAHGTLQYMSPERLEGLSTTASADLYSLGVVMYEMLSGRRPFTARAPLELIRAHHSQQPPPFPDAIARQIPTRLIELVFALLRKEPSRRPVSAAVVHVSISEFIQPAAPKYETPQHSAPQHLGPQGPGGSGGGPGHNAIDTVDLIEQFVDERGRRGRTARAALVGGVSVGVGLLVIAVLIGWVVESRQNDEALASSAKASTVQQEPRVDGASSANELRASSSVASSPSRRARSKNGRPQPPPPGSSREQMSAFLKARDPGGAVPVHPELQRTDYTVKVMVRRDLLEAQRGARIVADSIVNGARPKVQIIRRPRRGRSEHWVLVGRHVTRAEAIAHKPALRPILNQGAMHVDLAAKCALLGPIVDGVRECIPP